MSSYTSRQMRGARLKEERKRQGLSLVEVSRRTGFPITSIARWETDRDHDIRVSSACRLAHALGLPMEWFCEEADDR